MEIKDTWNISLADGYVDVSVDRHMGLYAIEVGGAEDFIIATEGEWLGGYSRSGRRIVFSILENTYINGRTAYFHLTSKKDPTKNVTVAVAQASMAYGFDFDERADEDETPEIERIEKYTQYIGVEFEKGSDKGLVYERQSGMATVPGNHRGSGTVYEVEHIDIPFTVYGGGRRCYVSSISQYHRNGSGKEVRDAYDSGVKAAVATSDYADGKHVLRISNFGKSYLAKEVYYAVRVNHFDNSDVYCEVRLGYEDDAESTLSFEESGSIDVDGNGGDVSLNVKNSLNYSDVWTTESNCDWITTVDSTEGVLVRISQFVLHSDDPVVADRTGTVRLLDADGTQVDSVVFRQVPIVSEEEEWEEEEEPPVSEDKVWNDETFDKLSPNPTNSRVMLQLSASWCIVKYSMGGGISLSQDEKDERYPFERKCRLLVKNANNLSKVLAFDIIQKDKKLTAISVTH